MSDEHFCVPAQCPCPRGVEYRDDRRQREARAAERIAQVLKEERCSLVGVPVYTQIASTEQGPVWATATRCKVKAT